MAFPGGGGGGGGVSDIFIHTQARLILGGFNFFLISTFLGVFRKMNIVWGITILWIFFGVSPKFGLYLGVISMHFRVSSTGQGTEWGGGVIFWVVKFLFFFYLGEGVLEIPDIS